MIITGYLKFDESLPVQSECLNEMFNITINGVEGILKTPKLPNGFPGESSEIMNKNLDQPEGEIKFTKELIWGRINTWPAGDSHISCCVLEFKVNDEKLLIDTGTTIMAGLSDWRIRLIDNLIPFDFILRYPNHNIKIGNIDFNLYYKKNSKIESAHHFQDSQPFLIHFQTNSISFNLFNEILNLTSKNKKPILEYKLIEESYYSLLEEDYRSAILNSSTAIELCLNNTLRREIKVEGNKLNEILKMHYGIFKKRLLIEIIGIKLPEHNYKKDIEELRNRAIHIGAEPIKDEAWNAFKICKEVINFLTKDKFE